MRAILAAHAAKRPGFLAIRTQMPSCMGKCTYAASAATPNTGKDDPEGVVVRAKK